MKRKDASKNENLMMVEAYELIKKDLLNMAQEGKVTCPQALTLAEKLGVKGSLVGQIANTYGVKIIHCQLGCFGIRGDQNDGI